MYIHYRHGHNGPMTFHHSSTSIKLSYCNIVKTSLIVIIEVPYRVLKPLNDCLI